jgi:hypothetical protein
MNAFAEAFAAVNGLKQELTQEIERARGERRLLRNLDADGLQQRARARDAFNLRAAQLERSLHDALVSAGRDVGLAEPSLRALVGAVPAEAQPLAAGVDEVRGLAAALAELDDFNARLGRRTLACIRGLLAVMAPRGSAYDRRGAAAAPSVPAVASLSRRA